MYHNTPQPKITEDKFLIAVKSFFRVCPNVKILLIGANNGKDFYPYYQSTMRYKMSMLMQDVYQSDVNTSKFEYICKSIGEKINDALLLTGQQYVKHWPTAQRSTIILHEYYRQPATIGFIGNQDAYVHLLEKYGKVDYQEGRYYYHNDFMNDKNFAAVNNETELYMFKGQPVCYLRCKVDKQNTNFQCQEICFEFALNVAGVEFYKI